mgnify:CR=1 FL=1
MLQAAITAMNNEFAKAVKASGSIFPVEACDDLNDASRHVIERMIAENGEAWLVNINTNAESLTKADTSADGWNLYNFCAQAVVPCNDEVLKQLINDFKSSRDTKILDSALDRVDELGGITLVWS